MIKKIAKYILKAELNRAYNEGRKQGYKQAQQFYGVDKDPVRRASIRKAKRFLETL